MVQGCAWHYCYIDVSIDEPSVLINGFGLVGRVGDQGWIEQNDRRRSWGVKDV